MKKSPKSRADQKLDIQEVLDDSLTLPLDAGFISQKTPTTFEEMYKMSEFYMQIENQREDSIERRKILNFNEPFKLR